MIVSSMKARVFEVYFRITRSLFNVYMRKGNVPRTEKPTASELLECIEGGQSKGVGEWWEMRQWHFFKHHFGCQIVVGQQYKMRDHLFVQDSIYWPPTTHHVPFVFSLQMKQTKNVCPLGACSLLGTSSVAVADHKDLHWKWTGDREKWLDFGCVLREVE